MREALELILWIILGLVKFVVVGGLLIAALGGVGLVLGYALIGLAKLIGT